MLTSLLAIAQRGAHVQALGGRVLAELEVEEHHVRPEPGGFGHRARGVGRLTDDGEVRLQVKDRSQALPDDGVVVDDQDPYRGGRRGPDHGSGPRPRSSPRSGSSPRPGSSPGSGSSPRSGSGVRGRLRGRLRVRDAGLDPQAAGAMAADPDDAAQFGRPFGHDPQAVPVPGSLTGQIATGRGRVAVAVVGDDEPRLPGPVLQVQPRLGRAGVPDHIPQAFLGDLHQRVLDRGREFPAAPADPDRYPQRARRAEVTGQVPQRLPQAHAGTLKLGQLRDGRSDPAQARAGQFLAGDQPPVRGRGWIEVAVAPFHVHADPDQALRDAIVQVAPDPVPFGTHQLRLPGPGQLATGPAELLVAAGQLLGVPLRLGPPGHRLTAQFFAMLEQPGVPQRRHDLVRHRLQDRHADPVRVSRMLRADQQ